MTRPPTPSDPSLGETLDAALAPTMAESSAVSVNAGEGRFVDHGELGRGGMGRVIDATDTQFGRRVAVKELLEPEPATSARFVREALVTGNLEHPGIPPVYERGERGGTPYYAMRRVVGRSLAEAIDSATALEERMKLLPAVVQIAHTLGFAHARGVVHRDVKPDNIMLGEHGEVVLLDWGIAKVRSSKSDGDLERAVSGRSGPAHSTGHGGIVGTPAYLAPEQAMGQVDGIDERTDVFALGALLYHLLAGRAPYDGLALSEVLSRSKNAEYTKLRELVSGLPRGLEAIVDKAMSKSPSDRFPTAETVARALEEFLAGAALAPDRDWTGFASFGVAAASALVVAVGGALLLRAVAPFAAQGWTAYGLFVLTALFAALAWVARTPERAIRLARPLLAIAAATFLLGIAGAFGGLSRAIAGVLLAHQAVNQLVLLEGVYESLSLIVTTAVLVAFQFLAWGWISRDRIDGPGGEPSFGSSQVARRGRAPKEG